MHKFGYTEEMLQTRLIEDIQENYEKLSSSASDIETKINNNTLQNQKYNITIRIYQKYKTLNRKYFNQIKNK